MEIALRTQQSHTFKFIVQTVDRLCLMSVLNLRDGSWSIALIESKDAVTNPFEGTTIPVCLPGYDAIKYGFFDDSCCHRTHSEQT